MKEVKIYKFKYKIINDFFLENDIIFIRKKLQDKEKYSYCNISIQDRNYTAILLNDKINYRQFFWFLNKKTQELIKSITFPNTLFVNQRIQLDTELMLSKELEIALQNIDSKIKNAYIVSFYFKLKEIIKTTGQKRFLQQYRIAYTNPDTLFMSKMINKGIIDKNRIYDFLEIVTLKNIIHIYSKEIDASVDYKNPSFKDNMLLKYLENYFSKLCIITYNQIKVKKFIAKYYIQDFQVEDRVHFFVYSFLMFYQMITNVLLNCENDFSGRIKSYPAEIFHAKKILKLKHKNFYKCFDKIMVQEENFLNFMFILEMMNFKVINSDRKCIIDYVSILELLLINGDKNISLQLQKKCIKIMKNYNFSVEEIKLIYDYRSKIIHGEYQNAMKKIHELSKLDKYMLSEIEIKNEIYLNQDQMIEEKIQQQLYLILMVAFKFFVFHNNYLKKLKMNK